MIDGETFYSLKLMCFSNDRYQKVVNSINFHSELVNMESKMKVQYLELAYYYYSLEATRAIIEMTQSKFLAAAFFALLVQLNQIDISREEVAIVFSITDPTIIEKLVAKFSKHLESYVSDRKLNLYGQSFKDIRGLLVS